MNVEKMKIEEVIKKINELYKLSKERDLTNEEKNLQKELRERYISNVKKNFRAQLDSIKVKR